MNDIPIKNLKNMAYADAGKQKNSLYMSVADVDLSLIYIPIFIVCMASAHTSGSLDMSILESSHDLGLEAVVSYLKDVNMNERLLTKVQNGMDLVMNLIRGEELRSVREIEKGFTQLMSDIIDLTSQTPLSFDGAGVTIRAIRAARRIKSFVLGLVGKALASLPPRRLGFLLYSLYIFFGLTGVSSHKSLFLLHSSSLRAMQLSLGSMGISTNVASFETETNDINGRQRGIDARTCALIYICRAFCVLPPEKRVSPKHLAHYTQNMKDLVEHLLDMNSILVAQDYIHLTPSTLSANEAHVLPYLVVEAMYSTNGTHQNSTMRSSRSISISTEDNRQIETPAIHSGNASANITRNTVNSTPAFTKNSFTTSISTSKVSSCNNRSIADESNRHQVPQIAVPSLNLSTLMPSWKPNGEQTVIEESDDSHDRSQDSDEISMYEEESPTMNSEIVQKTQSGDMPMPLIPPLALGPKNSKYHMTDLTSSANIMSATRYSYECPRRTLAHEAFLARLSVEHTRMLEVMETHERMILDTPEPLSKRQNS